MPTSASVVSIPLPVILIAVYAAIVFAGGLIGYLKAGSKPSLIAGTISGVLLAGAFWYAQKNGVTALGCAALIATVLTLVFLMRFLKTRSFMPSGMMLTLSLAAAIYFGLAAAGRL